MKVKVLRYHSLGQFTDIKDIKEEKLTRLKVDFEKWLNPWSSMRRESSISDYTGVK
jgi:hypothetical protein